MCGICGFYEFKNDASSSESRQILAAMCSEMEHRGPDDKGYYISNTGVGFGAVRLSILDVTGGHQPLSNEDGTCWVTLNGEIYNYPTLSKELAARGHIMRTKCDTETIVHAYEEWGLDCVHHLEGMFAFAIWDGKIKRLFLARDRLGKKPIYYNYNLDIFTFSSEIKSLLKHPKTEQNFDADAMDIFLTLGYIPGPLTIFKNIKKLLPGHLLILGENQDLNIKRYWDIPPPEAREDSTEDHFLDASRTLSNLIEQAVKDRLLADVPVGVFLSGGLDSSVITAMMRRHKTDNLKSFSASFREPEQNEAPFAQTVADHLGTEHYELAINNCTPSLVEKLIWHCDEPLADPAIVPTYLLSKLAREHVKVVLTGEGADELFAGYFSYPLERQAVKYDWLPMWAKQHLLIGSAKSINNMLGRMRFHARTMWAWQLHPSERMLAWNSIFTDEEKLKCFSPSTRSNITRRLSATYIKSVARNYSSNLWLTNFAYLNIKIPLVDDLLMKVDKMSMAASLEARCPYLDRSVVEYASKLPDSFKLRSGINKAVLRQVAATLLPTDITDRKKQGFSVPLRRWLTEDLRSFFWDMVSSSSFQKLDVISKPQVQDIWTEMENNVPVRAEQVWSLMILAAWSNSVLA